MTTTTVTIYLDMITDEYILEGGGGEERVDRKYQKPYPTALK